MPSPNRLRIAAEPAIGIARFGRKSLITALGQPVFSRFPRIRRSENLIDFGARSASMARSSRSGRNLMSVPWEAQGMFGVKLRARC
jgi:hypothetical protein